jgi:hypothetical protein
MLQQLEVEETCGVQRHCNDTAKAQTGGEEVDRALTSFLLFYYTWNFVTQKNFK